MLQYTEHPSPNAIVFAFHGSLSYSDYDTFKSIIDRMKHIHDQNVVFDLTDLESISGDGLSLLLISQNNAKLYDYRLHIKNPTQDRVSKLCRASKLHQIFEIECNGRCGGCK